jgi:hypothetical protein
MEDYVYCNLAPKDRGAGYYHLLNPVAYVNLFKRLESQAPPTGCCCGSAETKKEYDEYDNVRAIVAVLPVNLMTHKQQRMLLQKLKVLPKRDTM